MRSCPRLTGAPRLEYAEFLQINADKTVCTQDDWDTAMAMRQAVWSHPASKSLLKRKGKTEQSLTWHHPVGVDCKGRIDLLLDGKGRQKPMIVDLKTTLDASPEGFARSVAKYGYHVQAAFYKDGMKHGENRNCAFAIIAVEKAEPYAVGVYVLDDTAISQGRKDYEKVLTSWKTAVQSDVYPSYSDAPETLSLPEWAVTPEPLTV